VPGVTVIAVRPGARRRALASVGDLGVIAGWIGALTAVSVAGRAAAGSAPAATAAPAPQPPALAVDLAVFAMTVLPVGSYLAVTEAGPRQATAGKRWQGLCVTTSAGRRIGWRRALIRNGVKLLPWQLGHLAAARWFRGVDPSAPVWAAYWLSLAMATASVAVALRDRQGRALHDLVAGTRVVGGRVGS
jgi:uncharacterized RDD family membrane protein YckC